MAYQAGQLTGMVFGLVLFILIGRALMSRSAAGGSTLYRVGGYIFYALAAMSVFGWLVHVWQ